MELERSEVQMMGIKKVVAGSRNRKREKKMNATTNAKTRNVYVREITMPVVFCKDCKYWLKQGHGYPNVCIRDDMELAYDESAPLEMNADDFCSRGERKDD